MIRGETIVCLSPTPWGGIWRNRQHVMSRLAARNRVIFVEPYGTSVVGTMPPAGVALLSTPRSLPVGGRFLPTSVLRWTAPVVVAVNARLLVRLLRERLRQLGLTAPILWLYDPLHVGLVGRLNEKLVCWHVHDETSEFPGNRRIKTTIRNCERVLLARADLVFASSRSQYERRRPFGKKVHCTPNAGDFRHFNRALDPALPIPDDVHDLPRPILGFYGGVDFRIDIALLRFLAQNRPQSSIVLVGPDRLSVYHNDDRFSGLINIHSLGPRDYSIMPNYVKAFDVIIFPYVVPSSMRYAFPLKLYECLAAGKPIVSTVLPEILPFEGIIWIGHSPEDFVLKVEEAVQDQADAKQMEQRVSLARENTWDKRVEQMSDLIQDRLRSAGG